MSSQRGQPKHQNQYAWKPNAGRKINETEVGGRFRPLSEITGVCPRCREQIDWKRRYGKYKTLTEPAKCQRCTKRNVRQAYHKLCLGCAKEQKVCAKCCCRGDQIVGRDVSEVEAEQKMLEEAIKNARERDRRTLLRAMNRENKPKKSDKAPTMNDSKVGDIFPSTSLEEYAKSGRTNKMDDITVRDHDHDDNDYDDDDDDDDNDEGGNDDDGDDTGEDGVDPNTDEDTSIPETIEDGDCEDGRDVNQDTEENGEQSQRK